MVASRLAFNARAGNNGYSAGTASVSESDVTFAGGVCFFNLPACQAKLAARRGAKLKHTPPMGYFLAYAFSNLLRLLNTLNEPSFSAVSLSHLPSQTSSKLAMNESFELLSLPAAMA